MGDLVSRSLCWSGALLLLWASSAAAYEGAVNVHEVDAGVHIPVLTRAPTLTRFVEAQYPKEAAAEGLSAEVKLAVTIGADGKVADAQVTAPAGHGFDEAAMEAVKQFEFTPAEVDGQPAPIQIEYVYHFVLKPPEPDGGVPFAEGGVPEPTVRPAVLTGRIIQRGSRNRVSGATVRCGDDPDAPEAVSDPEGLFRLEVPPGRCAVRVVANGYKLFQTTEELKEGETTEVVYYLLQKVQGFETVVRSERDKKEVVRRTLDRQEIEKIPGTFGDPIRVIQNLPGVARAPYLSGALIVRGAAPDQTLTFMDGVEIPLLFHLLGGPSVINEEFLDKLDFYPGGFGARYGRAIGGVVDVSTRKGASDTWHGSVKLDLLDSSFFVEAPVAPGISVSAAARRSYVDLLLPVVLPKNYPTVLPRYWDYQVRMDIGSRKSAAGISANWFSVMAFGSDDTLKVVGNTNNRDITLDTHTLFHRVKGNWIYKIGNFTSSFAPYVGYDLASFSLGAVGFKGDRYSAGGREDISAELTPWLTVRGGVDAFFEHMVVHATIPSIPGVTFPAFPGGAQPQEELTPFDPIINSSDTALYLETDLKAGPVTLTPGLRGSYARVYGHSLRAWDPRLWVRYQIDLNTAVKGSVGLYSQPPQGFDLLPFPFGNPNVFEEHAFQSSLGVEHKFTDAINADVTFFYNRRYDMVNSPAPTRLLEDGTKTSLAADNSGLGRAYGVEVMIRHEITRNFFGWLAYTLSKSEDRTAGWSVDRNNALVYDPYHVDRYDQTHILTAVASYKLPLGFELSGRFRLVSGNPTTPVNHPEDGDHYMADSNSYSGIVGATNSGRLPTFHQLDIRVDKNFVFQSWTLDLYLDVQNVYNQPNEEAVLADYRRRQVEYVPGIPILPVLGVKGTF